METRLFGIDERNLWAYQTFHYHINESERGKILAQVLIQAVMTQKGKVIDPRSYLQSVMPIVDAFKNMDGAASIFDEKAERFTCLEDVLRRSATLRDESVDNN